MLEWLNNGQIDFEQYTVWKHWGTPFGEDEDETTNISFENGWQIYDTGIMDSGASWHSHSFSRTYNIQPEIEREAWYAVTISDMYGNENLEARPGSGGNALKIKEDSIKPTASYALYDDDDEPYDSPSLISGSYKIVVTIDEYLLIDPRMEITTDTGGVITGGMKQMLSYADNLAIDGLGPQYYLTFSISNVVSA